MAKRMTDTQRLIAFAMGADEASLSAAIESLAAIKANRYPKDARKPRKPRKPVVEAEGEKVKAADA